jgi:hypothetical protein
MWDVFLIVGYGAVAGFNVGDEKPSHNYGVSKKRTVARIRYCRGGREAGATCVQVASEHMHV